jgi:hypothetical protein
MRDKINNGKLRSREVKRSLDLTGPLIFDVFRALERLNCRCFIKEQNIVSRADNHQDLGSAPVAIGKAAADRKIR